MAVRRLGTGLLEKVLVSVEAVSFIIGAVLLYLVIEMPLRDPVEGLSGTVLSLIERPESIFLLATVALTYGCLALLSLIRKNLTLLAHSVFGFFMVRTYVLLATIVSVQGFADTRWTIHWPWVVVWGTYWLILRSRPSRRDE